MSDVISRANILQALYEEAPVIKMYVDLILQGKPAPYTLLMRSDESIKNEEIIERLWEVRNGCAESDLDLKNILDEILDEAMILEGEKYEVTYFKGEIMVEGSRQIVDADKIDDKKEYAKFKGYEISVKKVEDNG